MRISRSQEQWQTIIEDQQTSGLTILGYCQQQKLLTSSFYALRKKLSLSSGNFVRARITHRLNSLKSKLSSQ
jgi:putative transposase